MKAKDNKIKKWFKDHKDDIVPGLVLFGYYAIGFGIGCIATKKLVDMQNVTAIRTLQVDGILKFVDPRSNNEISIEEACKVYKEIKGL